ncbi:MAG: peptidoglycan-binding domain-containing protein [Christensenellales bacterium]
MKGERVKTLQETLLRLGFSLPRYGADGVFGGETAAALRAFQLAYGFPAHRRGGLRHPGRAAAVKEL